MHLRQLSVNGEDFIGLLGFSTDKYTLLSPNFPKVEILKVPEIRAKIYGTNLVGMFCSGNSNGLLLPYFVSDFEMEKLKEKLSGVDVEIEKIEDIHTALGNLIVCNDKAAIVSPRFGSIKMIEDILGVEVIKREIGGYMESGICCVVTNRGLLAHPDAEEELPELRKIFKVRGEIGSVNFGIPMVKAGLIANSHAYLAGESTTGIELGRIDEALGFLDEE